MSFFRFKTPSSQNKVSAKTIKISVICSLSFGFIALLSTVIIGIFVTHTQRTSIMASVEGGLHFLAQAYSINVSNYLSEQKEKISYLGKRSSLSSQELLEFLDDNNDFDSLFVVDHDGIIVASTISNLVGKHGLGHEHAGSKSGEVIVTDVHYSEALEKYTIDFVTPLGNSTMLVAVLSVEHLAKIAHPARITGDYIDVYLTDNKGVLLTPSKYLKGENKGVLTQTVSSQNVQNCLQANFDFKNNSQGLEKHIPQAGVYVDYRGEMVIGTHEHIIDPPWCLVVEGSKDILIDGPIKQTIQVIFVLGIVLVSLSAGVGFVIARVAAKYI